MIDAGEMDKLAAAARLELTDEERKDYAADLNEIISYMDKFLKMDLGEIEPFTFVHSIKNAMREDEEQPGLEQEVALANGPVTQDGQFLVPRII